MGQWYIHGDPEPARQSREAGSRKGLWLPLISQLLQAFGLAKSLGRIRSFLWSLLERIKLTRDFFRKYSSFVFKYATYTLTSKFSVLNLIFSVWWDSLGWFRVKKVQVKVKCTFRRVFSSLLHCCLGGSCLVLRVSVHVC